MRNVLISAPTGAGRRPRLLDLYCVAGGAELSQAIPPAYTEWLGVRLAAHLRRG